MVQVSSLFLSLWDICVVLTSIIVMTDLCFVFYRLLRPSTADRR